MFSIGPNLIPTRVPTSPFINRLKITIEKLRKTPLPSSAFGQSIYETRCLMPWTILYLYILREHTPMERQKGLWKKLLPDNSNRIGLSQETISDNSFSLVLQAS